MRCVVSCGSTSFLWLVFFFGALLWGSMIHKHTGRWMWQGSALREILLSFQTGFNLVSAAVVCAILETISGLEPSSVITEPRYLKLMTVSRFCLLWSLCWCHWCCLSSAWSSRHWSSCRRLWRLLSKRSTNFASSSSFHAEASMSSEKRRLVIVLPPMLTVSSWSSKASIMVLSRNMLKKVGESRYPCRTPTVVRNQSPMLLLKRTALVSLS